ncbi:LexA family transcriptional regulator [Massilia sp. 9096]|uniref:LexA family transcriptional regulator n=1 Tax=Massilia sp. 9096 TaxID=1500894 RepID=UPI0012DFF1CF|nr:LexA family transcriptional regulator [Massilia sp. 9096]
MKRLYEAAEALAGLKTQAEIARALNQSQQTVNNWEARGISKAGLLKAQSAIGCSATWLETGAPPMALAPHLADKGAPAFAAASPDHPFLTDARGVRIGDEPDTIPIRRVSLKLHAGVTGFETEPELEDGGVLHMPRAVIEAHRLAPHQLLAIRVRGQSMEPMMFEDDVVVVNTADKEPVSREIYAVNFNGEALVKQLLRRNNEWFLQSMNPDFGPVNVRSGQCSIVGRVVYQPGRVLTGRL